MNAEYASMLTSEVEDLIAELQGVQKRSRPGSPEWQAASNALQPLFTEMADRTRAA
jgi:hypothetical protein